MSSLCCCQGLLSIFGGRSYPLDVVAKTKLDRAKMNREKQNNYSTMPEGANGNGNVVRSEPYDLSDASRASSSRSNRRTQRRKPSSRRSHRSERRTRRRARSFDDSDSDSSNDSEEESQEVIKRTLQKSLRGSRDTLATTENGFRGSGSSIRTRDVELEDETIMSVSSAGKAQKKLPPPFPSSPPRNYREDDIPDMGEHELTSSEFQTTESPERRRVTIPGTRIRTKERGGEAFPFHQEEEITSTEGTPQTERRTIGSTREFHRKAVRKSGPMGSPSLSMRSQRSVSPTYSSGKWNMEDAGSIYRETQLSSGYKGSEEDEVAMAKKASQTATRSIDESDEEVQERGLEPISSCGTLDVAVQYYLSEKKLQVTIIEAHDLPSKARGGSSIVQVRAVLLPEKKKRYKTKVQHVGTPRFAETFKLTRASPDELRALALRLRLYGIGKLKDRLIGEAVIRFDELNLIRDPQLTIQLELEPRTDINRGESMSSLSNVDSRASSMMSLSHGGNPPEILIGLSYNAPTGRLCVEVLKGSHFRNLAMAKPPDTFVKLSLLNSACQEMSQSKTTIRRGQPNPVYKETFFFQVALFQLGEVTLMVSVYNKRTIKKKEMIGWVSMGRNSSSEIDEQHWQEMKEGKGQQISRWHALIDT